MIRAFLTRVYVVNVVLWSSIYTTLHIHTQVSLVLSCHCDYFLA